MLTLIKMDLKQRFKSPMTWFIILILFVMSMLNIIETRKVRLNRPFEDHDVYSWSSREIYDWTQSYDEERKKLYPKLYYSQEIRTKIKEDVIVANEESDIKEINRLMSFYHLLFAKQGFIGADPIMNIVFEKKAMKIWEDVSGGIPYENIDFNPERMFTSEANTYLLISKYYHQLYINDLEPIYYDDMNNITYLYDYFFHIVPKLMAIISIFLIYNIINKEKNSGSLKLILTQSISRWKYYISKWISGVSHVVFVLFFPPVAISTILGFTNGFISMKYPTIYLKGTMTSFKPIPNYFDTLRQKIGDHLLRFDFRTFSYAAPGHKSYSDWVYEHKNTEFIAFYKYLLMVILLTMLFIGFCVALVQLISAIMDKEIISFVIASTIFVTGILISSPFKYEKSLNLSPFTMENASRIIIGTYNVTGLVSILILLGSTILLLGIGCRYFRRKEI